MCVQIKLNNAGGEVVLGTTNINQNFRVATIKVNSDYRFNEIKIDNAKSIQLIVDDTYYCKRKTLYFLNRKGGWEWYNFIDFDAVERADKLQLTKYENHENDLRIQQLINSSTTELKLYGKTVNYNSIHYLRDLVVSPIVLDETGKQVRVIDNNIQFSGTGLIEPEISIQYIKEDTIKF